MRRIIATGNTTIDGYMEGPNGEGRDVVILKSGGLALQDLSARD